MRHPATLITMPIPANYYYNYYYNNRVGRVRWSLLYNTTPTGDHMAYNTTHIYPKQQIFIAINTFSGEMGALIWQGPLYLITIGSQSHATFTKSVIMLSRVGSNIAPTHSTSLMESYLVIICNNPHGKITKMATRQIWESIPKSPD